MENKTYSFEKKIDLLKEARKQLLKLHKFLIDIERQKYETKNGQASSGQFLQILLNDENFSWLRKFSVLIVEIDEMLDLNDGFTEEMVNKRLFQIESLLSFENPDEEFNSKYRQSVENNSEVKIKHNELQKMLAEK